jgi:hypothetical protein
MDRKKMKTITLIVLSLGIWIVPLSAQKTFFLTPRAGMNLATITSTTGSSLRPGINYGISGDYMFTTHWAAEIGFNYSMQGTSFRSASLSPEHDYILIPLLAKYYVTGGLNGVGWNVFAGPQIDIKAMVNKVGYTTGYEGALLPFDMNKALGMSAVIGGGYLFKTGFMLSANMNLGLTNKANSHTKDYLPPVKENPLIVDTNKSYKNFALQFNFGYRFSLCRPKPSAPVGL